MAREREIEREIEGRLNLPRGRFRRRWRRASELVSRRLPLSSSFSSASSSSCLFFFLVLNQHELVRALASAASESGNSRKSPLFPFHSRPFFFNAAR